MMNPLFKLFAKTVALNVAATTAAVLIVKAGEKAAQSLRNHENDVNEKDDDVIQDASQKQPRYKDIPYKDFIKQSNATKNNEQSPTSKVVHKIAEQWENVAKNLEEEAKNTQEKFSSIKEKIDENLDQPTPAKNQEEFDSKNKRKRVVTKRRNSTMQETVKLSDLLKNKDGQ